MNQENRGSPSRHIAIVGAGQAGLLLGVALLDKGYSVTIVTNRSSSEIRGGKVLSSQLMFDAALQIERDLGMNQWEDNCPQINAVSFSIAGPGGMNAPVIQWRAQLGSSAQSVDQRVKMPGWMQAFEQRGGQLRIETVGIAELEALTREHELVLLAGGKGEIVDLFGRDDSRSSLRQPMRHLALTYVTGMQPQAHGNCINFNLIPGIGEYVAFPALTTSGDADTRPCDIMLFEGIPGGPMDCWSDTLTPEQHLGLSLDLLRTHVPWEYERAQSCAMTDPNGRLTGRITPTVRHAVLTLPSGRRVMGLGDAILLNDPITGQGSNNAAMAARHYLEAILARGAQAFDEPWMTRTFGELYSGYAEKVVAWTNSLLMPPPAHVVKLMATAQQVPSIASRFAYGFTDPHDFSDYWFSEQATEALIQREVAAMAA